MNRVKWGKMGHFFDNLSNGDHDNGGEDGVWKPSKKAILIPIG